MLLSSSLMINYAEVAINLSKDLVLYDFPDRNPFRDLIPLAQHYPVLLQIIIAISALHMSNTEQKSLVLPTTTSSLRSEPHSPTPCSASKSVSSRPKSYNDALIAKQCALRMLRIVLVNPRPTEVDVDVALGAVLLFIQFQLVDSGRDHWRQHIDGARTIMQTYFGSNIATRSQASPLRRCLAANCLVYVNHLNSGHPTLRRSLTDCTVSMP